MESPLLVTKFQIAPLRPDLVLRSRLIEQLNDSKRRRQRLVLVSAPAGFGKTTLINEWISHHNAEQVVWLSLDEQDDDAGHFLSLLIAALQQIDENIGLAVQQALYLPQPPSIASLMTALVNDMTALVSEILLVFDDLHLIADERIHESIGFLIDHLPTTVMTIIITREDPPLPLARLRVRHQLLELREHDLRFTPEETEAFFQNTIRLGLSAESIQQLSTQTEGWVAGIQLAALALQSANINAETFLAAFSGSDRYVADYLMSEVLSHLPAELQEFLVQTSILDRLSAPLCDALTGRSDSQVVLAQLEASNLFLIPLDHHREWYRYYRLFGEFMRGRLDASEQHDLNVKALRWHERNNYPDQALQHALAAAEYEDAERLFLKTAEAMLHSGGISTLANRLDSLPDGYLRTSTPLSVYKGLLSVITGDLETAEEYALVIQQQAQLKQVHHETAGQFALLQAFIALARRDDHAGIAFVTEALKTLSQTTWRLMALWLVAEAHERTGNIRAAITALTEAQQIGFSRPIQMFTVIIDAFLASAFNEQGQLPVAIAICERALTRYVTHTGEPLTVAALVYARLALLMLEANRVEDAQRFYAQFQQLALPLFGDGLNSLLQGIHARILAASGETDLALGVLRSLNQSPDQAALSDSGWLVADEMNLRLRIGDVTPVRQWADQRSWKLANPVRYLGFEEQLAYVHYLVLADELDEAELWLERLQEFTAANALRRKQLAVSILRALAAARADDPKQTRRWLTLALETAAPQGYVGVFLEYGEPVLELLPRVRETFPAFVDAILNAARRHKPIPSQALVDPLSDREIEVLRLVAAGLSNGEIAERLFITLGTVKRHINHIYGKLDVRTRTQALVKARELTLLKS